MSEPPSVHLRLLWLAAAILFALCTAVPGVQCEENAEADVVTEAPSVPFDPTLVEVTEGKVRGHKEEAVNGKEFYSFRGLPFAKPPVGNLRFKPPQATDKTEGILVADKDPTPCSQLSMVELATKGSVKYEGSEDCLYLNVFSPMPEEADDSSLLPVMVYLHGGSFQHGYAAEYQPYALMSKDIVLVVIQYRLSTLGFLSTEDDEGPGNMGILDQTAALSWVQNNAPAFRGNPLQITIFGESAGAASVHFQVLSHASLGFFHRAILQSGNAISSWSCATNHRQVAYHMAKLLGCGTSTKVEPEESCERNEEDPFEFESCVVDQLSSAAVLECLREAPAQSLVELTTVFSKFGSFPLLMAPRVDKNILMKDPLHLLKEHRSKKVDVMLGVTKDEGSLWAKRIFANEGTRSVLRFKFEENGPILLDFGVGDVAPLNQTIGLFDFYVGNADFEFESIDNLTALMGDRLMWYPADTLAHCIANDEAAQRKSKKLFVYQFDYLSETRPDSIFDYGIGKHYIEHTEDLVYLFDTPHGHPWFNAPLTTEDDIAIRDAMVEMWTNFAKTGNPTPENHPVEWLPYTKDVPRILHINKDIRIVDKDLKKEVRDFWRQLPLRMNLVLFPESVANLQVIEASSDDTPAPLDGRTEETIPTEHEEPQENLSVDSKAEFGLDVGDGDESSQEETHFGDSDGSSQDEKPRDEL